MRDVYEIRIEEFYLCIVFLIGLSCEVLFKFFIDLLIVKLLVENFRCFFLGNKKFYLDVFFFVFVGREERGCKFVVE